MVTESVFSRLTDGGVADELSIGLSDMVTAFVMGKAVVGSAVISRVVDGAIVLVLLVDILSDFQLRIGSNHLPDLSELNTGWKGAGVDGFEGDAAVDCSDTDESAVEPDEFVVTFPSFSSAKGAGVGDAATTATRSQIKIIRAIKGKAAGVKEGEKIPK